MVHLKGDKRSDGKIGRLGNGMSEETQEPKGHTVQEIAKRGEQKEPIPV